MSFKQDILAPLMNPNMVFFIFVVGILALYFEFNHPGAYAPGVIGIICIALSLFALTILPTNYTGFALIIGAFILFVMEAKYQTHGVLGIGGVLMMVMGALMLVDGPIPEMRVNKLTALAVSLPFGVITIVLMNIALRARKNKILIGQESMIGMEGKVETQLHPEGKVIVMGDLWNAVCPEGAEPGDTIVIRKVNGLHLEVEKKMLAPTSNIA